MRKMALSLVILLAAGEWSCTSVAVTVVPKAEHLPPSQATDGEGFAGDRSIPTPGDYAFVRLDPSEGWIEATALKEVGGDPFAAIQLDRLYFPLTDEYGEDVSKTIRRSINDAILTALPRGDSFRFVPTCRAYDSGDQIGGVVYLKNGHTLQDVLISQGLARVDLESMGPPLWAKINKQLWDYWLACEAQAKTQQRGFWKTHPELMHQVGDPPME